MTQLFVERLTATACASDAARVRRLLSGVADHRLDQALGGASLASGDWCVRRVDVELRIDDRQTDGWIEERWAQALMSALKQRIGSHTEDVIHYRHPAQGLADLLAGLAAGRLEREWAWRQLGLLGPGDPGGDNPRAAACAAARRRPELALAALVEAIDRIGVIALHRMLGGDGWAELAAVVAAALGVPGLATARATSPESEVDRGAERVADRVVSRSRLAARFRQARVRVDAQTAGAWAVLVAAEAEPAVIRGDRAGAVVSALAGDRVIPGPPEDGGPSAHRPIRALGDAPSGTESPTEPTKPAREVLPRASSQATGSAEPVRQADRRRRRDDRPADTAPQPPADGEPRSAGHRPAAGDHSGVDGTRDDLDPHDPRPLDVPRADDADRRLTSWAGLFFLLATAADAGIPEALLADEALSDHPLHWTLHHLGRRLVPAEPSDPALFAFSGTAPTAHPPRPEPDPRVVEALDRHALRWARSTARRLGEPDEGSDTEPLELVTQIAARPGALSVWPGWVEVHLPLSGVDVAVRRAGLDVDPGWMPWLGIVVMFRYE